MLLLNNNKILNLEMQVRNEGNWPDRSLLYLCRCFDRLQKGQKYETVLPAIHIGILDFTLFEDDPEFYASNKMMNIKSHKIFNDKFILNVLSLKQIGRATDEDKAWQLDTWAKLFAAKTWRDIKMIAKNNDILTSATQSLYQLNADELIREQCQAREDYERLERTQLKTISDLKETVCKQTDTITRQTESLNEKDSEIQNLSNQVALLQSEIEKMKK